MEGAAYSLQQQYDPELDAYLDSLIFKIAAAQEEDGYLYTIRTIKPDSLTEYEGQERWEKVRMHSHELYNVEHLYEAAVAHYQATGKTNFLDIALKNAKLIQSVYGPGKRHDAPGHQEIELGLIKLFRVTGEKKYLDLARFFLDERGTSAIRNYDSPSMWENVVYKKLYITGGIGAKYEGEAFGTASSHGCRNRPHTLPVNPNRHLYDVPGQQGFNNFRPFNKTVIPAVDIFFKADIKNFFYLFYPVKIKMKNGRMVSAGIFIHNGKARAGNIILRTNHLAYCLDKGSFPGTQLSGEGKNPLVTESTD